MSKFTKMYTVLALVLISTMGFSNLNNYHIIYEDNGSDLANVYSDSLNYAIQKNDSYLIEKYSIILGLLSDSSSLNSKLAESFKNDFIDICSVSDYKVKGKQQSFIYGEVSKIEHVNSGESSYTNIYVYDTNNNDYIKLKITKEYSFIFNDIQNFFFGETVLISNFIIEDNSILIKDYESIIVL